MPLITLIDNDGNKYEVFENDWGNPHCHVFAGGNPRNKGQYFLANSSCGTIPAVSEGREMYGEFKSNPRLRKIAMKFVELHAQELLDAWLGNYCRPQTKPTENRGKNNPKDFTGTGKSIGGASKGLYKAARNVDGF